MAKITVKATEITIIQIRDEDYISLTNIAKYKSDDPSAVIGNWLRNRNTLEYLGLWETLYNPAFKPLEFEGFRRQAGSTLLHYLLKNGRTLPPPIAQVAGAKGPPPPASAGGGGFFVGGGHLTAARTGSVHYKDKENTMFEANAAATLPPVKFDGPPWTEPDWTDEEIAERIARIGRIAEECRRLNEIEPLPDNFEAICEGRETVPVYSQARAA